jgi:hypothetical protein
VLQSDFQPLPISADNKLPTSCNRAAATRLGAVRVAIEDHDLLLDEIARRHIIDHDEDPEEEPFAADSSDDALDLSDDEDEEDE